MLIFYDFLAAPSLSDFRRCSLLFLRLWTKATSRLAAHALDGAFTAARALLESVCKLALHETGTAFTNADDLPKLYHLAASALGIATRDQTEQTLKAIFGAASTLVRSVAELRNQSGDAHGKAEAHLPASYSQAELAVHIAGVVAKFLLTSVESYVVASKKIYLFGRVALRFEKSVVWRLRDHAFNAPKSLPSYRRRTGPALWLVGDTGVYLMSNGSPPMSYSGEVFQPKNGEQRFRLAVWAEGCDPGVDKFEQWRRVHKAIGGGDDFSFVNPLDAISAALQDADTHIVVLITKRSVTTMGDQRFSKLKK